MSRRLGRGLEALIHAVEPIEEPITLSPPVSWSVEHLGALSSPALRLQARDALQKLSTRPRTGIRSARSYLDKIARLPSPWWTFHEELGMPKDASISRPLDHVDLTHCCLLQLKDGRLARSERQELTKWKTK